MIKQLSIIGILGSAASLSFATVTNALSTVDLNWTGDGGYKFTGTFSYDETNSTITSDGFIRSPLNNGGVNEITSFQASFYQPDNTLLATYNGTDLLTDTFFNFNYQISTGQVLQSAGANTANGFSLGNTDNGYSLDTSGGKINLYNAANMTTLDSKNYGTLTASTTPVPFDFQSTIGLTILGSFWGVKIWRRKLLSSQQNDQ